jgi:hypothetical protein
MQSWRRRPGWGKRAGAFGVRRRHGDCRLALPAGARDVNASLITHDEIARRQDDMAR